MIEANGPELLRRALAGDRTATRELVRFLSPVVHARVARAVLRSRQGRSQGRDIRQDIEDFVQEVFVAMLADRGRPLRAWDPARGMSFPNFVGMLAEHEVASILRSGRRSPWTEEATKSESMDHWAGATESHDARVSSRELLARIIERLRAELTPAGFEIFQLLIVEDRTVEDVCNRTGLSSDAIYAWRSRLGKRAREMRRELLGDVPLGPQ